jgi:hypothetical protein
MAFVWITVVRLLELQRRGTVSKSSEKTHPIECALSSGRIVITMMATSKHLIKQQDEVFIGVCRRSPYM